MSYVVLLKLTPGSGSLSSPLVFALQGKKNPTIVGKPNKPMMDAIIAEHQFDKSRALMVGGMCQLPCSLLLLRFS